MNNAGFAGNRFWVSYGIYERNLALSKSDKALFVALFALNYKLVEKFGKHPFVGWFNSSNKELCKMAGINEATLRRSRKSLLQKGLIDYKRGYPGINSEYRILIGMVSKEHNY